MKNIIAACALALVAGFSANTASAQAEALAIGSITATTVVAGIIVATVIVAISDDGTVTTTTVALGPA